MSESATLEAYKEAYRQMRIDEEKQHFRGHALVYVLVNAGLIALNLTTSPDNLWFYWPLLGWGIGLVFHWWGGVRNIEEEVFREQAELEARARQIR